VLVILLHQGVNAMIFKYLTPTKLDKNGNFCQITAIYAEEYFYHNFGF
jgi:hypothetical protein